MIRRVAAGVTWWREWGWIGSLSGATFKTKKTCQRSMRRGPPWLDIVGLSQVDDALFSRSTSTIILGLIRGVELVEVRTTIFSTHGSGLNDPRTLPIPGFSKRTEAGEGVFGQTPGAGHDFRRRTEFIPFYLFLHSVAIEPEVRPAGSQRNEFRSTTKDPSENVADPWFFPAFQGWRGRFRTDSYYAGEEVSHAIAYQPEASARDTSRGPSLTLRVGMTFLLPG